MDGLKDSLRVALETVCRDLPVRLVVLFGSQAQGRARPDSDVDIGVWFSGDPDYRALSRIASAVEAVVQRRDVDCVPLDFDHPSFALNVAQSCEPLYDRSGRAFMEFFLTAHNEYDDALEWRRAGKQYLDAWVAAHT